MGIVSAWSNNSKVCWKISLSSTRPPLNIFHAGALATRIGEFPSEYFPFSLSLSEKYVFRTVHALVAFRGESGCKLQRDVNITAKFIYFETCVIDLEYRLFCNVRMSHFALRLESKRKIINAHSELKSILSCVR